MRAAPPGAPPSSPWQESIDRSRERRAAQSRRRRMRLRLRTAVVTGTVAMTALGGVAFAASGGTSSQSQGSGSSSTTLGPGSSGPTVSALQRALHIHVTGHYDSATTRAVKSFQRAHGLSVDGVAGPQTLSALGVHAAGHRRSRKGVSAELAKIARCESGGDPTAVSPDGKFRGKYQFDMSTWHSLGGSGDPAQAPESTQDKLAAKLYRERGTAPWPNCA